MTTMRDVIRVLLLDYGLRLIQADVDRMKGVDNPDTAKNPTEICEDVLDKFFKEQSK